MTMMKLSFPLETASSHCAIALLAYELATGTPLRMTGLLAPSELSRSWDTVAPCYKEFDALRVPPTCASYCEPHRSVAVGRSSKAAAHRWNACRPRCMALLFSICGDKDFPVPTKEPTRQRWREPNLTQRELLPFLFVRDYRLACLSTRNTKDVGRTDCRALKARTDYKTRSATLINAHSTETSCIKRIMLRCYRQDPLAMSLPIPPKCAFMPWRTGSRAPPSRP